MGRVGTKEYGEGSRREEHMVTRGKSEDGYAELWKTSREGRQYGDIREMPK